MALLRPQATFVPPPVPDQKATVFVPAAIACNAALASVLSAYGRVYSSVFAAALTPQAACDQLGIDAATAFVVLEALKRAANAIQPAVIPALPPYTANPDGTVTLG